jgi:hypothetical protein
MAELYGKVTTYRVDSDGIGSCKLTEAVLMGGRRLELPTKLSQERSQSALRHEAEEPEQRPQSALRGLLGDISERSEAYQSEISGILGKITSFNFILV